MKDEIVSLAKELIAIPSVSGDIDQSVAILELAKRKLPNFEFSAFASNKFPSLLISNSDKNQRKFKIILNAHLDVVPGTAEQFQPSVQNGKLYGRGAYDMKGAAAAMIILFSDIARKIPYPLGLQLTCDEEVSGLNGTKYQIDQGVRGNFIITGEGSNFRIIHESKGRLILKLTAKGKTSHSAYPWLGDNAIWKLQRALHTIIENYPIPKEESGNTTVNITSIHTNNLVNNRTPDHCEAILDIRFLPSEKNTIAEKLQSLIPFDITLEEVYTKGSRIHETHPDNEYIRILRQVSERALPLGRAHGISDMPFYTEVGCDGIEFGPIGARHHAENEWVDIQSLEEYYSILKQFLLSVAQLDDSRKNTSHVSEKPMLFQQEK